MINFLESDNKRDMFRETANKLLNKCFIIKQKDKEAYFFIAQNLQAFREYFDYLDYDVEKNEMGEVICLIGRSNNGRLRLKKYESILLLILRLLYIEKRKTLSETTDVVVRTMEIQDKYNMLKISTKGKETLDKSTLNDAIRTFKKYNLVENVDTDITQDDSRILVYPSVYFALCNEDIEKAYNQANQKLKNYVQGGEISDETTDED